MQSPTIILGRFLRHCLRAADEADRIPRPPDDMARRAGELDGIAGLVKQFRTKGTGEEP